MIEEEDEILKSLQKLAVLTGEGQEVKENQITEFLVNSVCYAVESRCGIRDDTLDFSFICGFQRMRRFCTEQDGWYLIYLGGLCYRLQGP